MSLTRRFSWRPEQVPLRSGDVLLLYEEKNEGYVYSELSGSHNNSVCFFPVKPPYSKEDPGIPDINCSTFTVYLDSENDVRKPIHFGQLIKLKHTASGHYLKPDRTKTSWSGELGHIMVELRDDYDSDADKGSFLFKILPQSGVRTRATHVHFNQPLRFESVNVSGHFLHCSDNTYDSHFPVYADRYELNLSTVASHLMMVPHFRPEPTMHVGLQLRAGQLLQIRETKGSFSLFANGSFLQTPSVIENVYLREKYTDVCQSWFPPSLWQLEDELENTGGHQLKFSSKYRIKHVLTRKYLAVVRCEDDDMEEFKVVLQDRNLYEWPENDTLFSVIPPSQQVDQLEDDYIPDGEHVLFKHEFTGLWLSVVHDDTDNTNKVLSLRRYAKDAFAVSSIPQNVQKQLYEVTGIAQLLSYSVLTGNVGLGIMKELEELEDIQNKRPFLRHLQVLDMLIKLTSGEVTGIDANRFNGSAFKVFGKYAKTEDLNEKNFLTPHLPFFLSQVGKGINAEDVISSMVKDNLRLVSRMGESLIEDTLRQLPVSKELLILLGYLCVSSGTPIPLNQTYILENFIKTSQHQLHRTALQDGDLYIQLCGTSDLLEWRECPLEVMKFLESQLLLFAKLCEGNHRESITYLNKDQRKDGFVSFEEALAFAADTNLPEAIQAICIRLIRVMFVEGHETSRAVFQSPAWCLDASRLALAEETGQVQERDPTAAVNGVQNESIPQLKAYVLQFLEPEQWTLYNRATTRGRTYTGGQFRGRKIPEVMRMLLSMAKHGYYHAPEDVGPLFQSCVALLDTTHSTEVRHTVENLLAVAFHVQLRETAELKIRLFPQLQIVQPPQRRTANRISLSKLSALDGIRTATAPQRVLLSHFYWMSLQTMQHDIQLLTVDQSLQEVDEIWKQYPELQNYLGSTVSREDSRKAADILLEFAKRCIVKGFPHRRNQELYSNFALNDVLNFVLDHNTALLQKTPGVLAEAYEVLLDACFIFLKALAFKRLCIQIRLFRHLDEFLELSCAIPAMADLLTEIFAGGSLEELPTEAHLQHIQAVHLQVTNHQLKTIFELISKGVGINSFIHVLQSLAKYEDLDLAIPRNVDILMKHFLEAQKSFCGELLGSSQEKKEHRMNLLKKKPTEHTAHSMKELTLLLNITTFLASCAEARNPSICTKCQALYSTHELLSIVNDAEISYAHKTPFLHFLVSVYMDDGDVGKMDAGMLWGYLHNVAKVLQYAISITEGKRREYVQTVLLRTSKQDVTRSGEDFGSSSMKKLQGILLHVLKGVLPLLKQFYQEFAFHPSLIDYLQQQSQMSVEISNALWKLTKVLMNIPIPQHYRNSVQVTVMVVTNSLFNAQILTHAMLPPEAMRWLSSVSSLTLPRTTSAILSLEEYNQLYSREELLNEGFREYLKEELKRPRGKKARRQTALESSLVEGPGFTELLDLIKCEFGKITVHDISGIVTERLLSDSSLMELRQKPHLCNIAIKCLQTMRVHVEQLKQDGSGGSTLSKFSEDLDTDFIVQVMNLAGLSDIEHLSKEALALLVSLMDSRDSPIVKRLTESVQSVSDPHTQSAEVRADSQKLQQALGHLMQSIDRSIQTAMTASAERMDVWKEVSLREKEDTDIKSTFEQYSKAPKKKKGKRNGAATDNHIDEDKAAPMGNSVTVFSWSGKAEDQLPTVLHSDDAIEVWIDLQGDDGEANGESIPLVPLSTDDDTATDEVQLPDTPARQTHEKYPSPSEQGLQVVIPSIDSLKLMLQLLGLMCDGQNQTLQNYMQKQPGQIESFNIVRCLQQLLKHFQRMHTDPENEGVLMLSVEDMQVLQLILQALILCCVANSENQSMIVRGNVGESIRWILAVTLPSSRGSQYPTELLNLKSTAAIMIDILTEEQEDDLKELLHSNELQRTLPDALKNFHKILQSQTTSPTGLWLRFVQGQTFGISSDSAKQSLIRVYHSGLGRVWKTKGEKENALSFCEKNSRSIEVLYGNRGGEKIHTTVTFPYDPADELSEVLKREVKAKVDRSNPDNKLLDFLDWMDAAKRDIQWQRKLRHSLIARIVTLFSQLRLYLLILLTILLNIVLLATFTVPDDNRPPDDVEERPLRNYSLTFVPDTAVWFDPGNPEATVFFILALSHLALSAWMVLEYYVVNWPHFVVHGVLGAIVPKFISSAIFKLVKTWKKGISESLRNWLQENQELENFELRFNQLESVYRVIFLAASGTSIIWYGYFYPICTFYIVLESSVLREVLRAVTKHGKSLLLVALLGVLVLYTYSVVSFAIIHEAFYREDTPTLHCKTLWECFISVSRIGLINDLGEIPLVSGEFRELAFRAIYDVSFFIIVTTIGLNIVLGIIVDTFSELREERTIAHQDSKDFCFICNIPSHEFDRKENHGFQRHIKQDHGMWNYIYYYVYLDGLDPHNHTAIQSYVYRKIQSQQTKFFPLYMAKCLGGAYTSSHLEQKVDELGQAVITQGVTLENKLQELSETIETLDKVPQRKVSLYPSSPRSSIAIPPKVNKRGSLVGTTAPSVFVFDDVDESPKAGSLRRKSDPSQQQQQMELLSKQMDTVNNKLAAVLQKLQMVEVLPQGGPEEVPNPTGLLSSSLPSSAIEEPNTAISSARQEETREQGPHLKLGNEIKDIGSSRKDRKLVVHPSPPRKEPEIRLKAVQTPVDSIKPAAKEVKAATKGEQRSEPKF